MESPAVSVVMAVRDGAAWLGEAVRSLQDQTLANLELIVVDDGSEDASPAILAQFARADPRIRCLRQEPAGLVSALNRGLSEARAPLLARLDADDRAHPRRLEAQIRHLGAHPGIGLLGTWAHTIDANGARIGSRRPATDPEQLRSILQRTNPFVHSSVMTRTALVRRVGGYREAFAGAEDDDLWLRLAEATRLANLPGFLVDYRLRAETRSADRMLRQAFSARLARRSAALRRATGADPADALLRPPDWRAPEAQNGFFGDIAVLYRTLESGDGAGLAALPKLALTPAERRLAGRAIGMALEAGGWREALRLVFRHPGFAANALWRTYRPERMET